MVTCHVCIYHQTQSWDMFGSDNSACVSNRRNINWDGWPQNAQEIDLQTHFETIETHALAHTDIYFLDKFDLKTQLTDMQLDLLLYHWISIFSSLHGRSMWRNVSEMPCSKCHVAFPSRKSRIDHHPSHAILICHGGCVCVWDPRWGLLMRDIRIHRRPIFLIHLIPQFTHVVDESHRSLIHLFEHGFTNLSFHSLFHLADVLGQLHNLFLDIHEFAMCTISHPIFVSGDVSVRFTLPVLVFPCVEHMFATDTMMSSRHIQQGIYACLGHMLGEICKSFLKVQEDSRRFKKI